MKTRRFDWLWGVVLIVMGGLFLLETAGIVPQFAPIIWSAVFAAGSLLFFVVYFLSGFDQWGWLFPAIILAGLAAVMVLAEATVYRNWIWALFMGCVSLPFWIVYLMNRRGNWWATIPGWVTAVLTLIILFSDQVADEWIGTFVMWSIALPFLVVYLTNRQHWWALIPAFVMGIMGLVVLLGSQLSGEWMGSLVMFVVAMPFWAVYLYSRQQWWAVIPAGIMTTIGFIAPFTPQINPDDATGRLITAVLFLGIAAPFAFLWWRRNQHPTDWAKYPTIGLTLFALLTLVFGTRVEYFWPVLLIGLGVWLLYNESFRPKFKP